MRRPEHEIWADQLPGGACKTQVGIAMRWCKIVAPMRLSSIALSLCIFLAACGEPAPPTRSTRRPDAGDNGDGDGDGDSGDGDGDGDNGDGDGDGDDIGVGVGGTSLVAIDKQFVPQPEDLRGFNSGAGPSVIDLSDDGHVLFRDYETNVEPGERAFIWRGSGEPELIPLPSGTERMRVVCLLTDDRMVIGWPLVNPVTGLYSYNSLLPLLVENGVAAQLANPESHYFDIVRCNEAGQVLAQQWQVIGSGPVLDIPSVSTTSHGFNNAGMALFDKDYWDGTELHPLLPGFKAYSGPTEKGLMLVSIDELIESETNAVLWNPEEPDESKATTFVPLLPVSRKVPEPIMIGPEGDVVVGTGIFDEEPNDVYLYRKGRFSMLGTEGTHFGEVLDVNAKGQVLLEVTASDAAKGHAAVLFTPKD